MKGMFLLVLLVSLVGCQTDSLQPTSQKQKSLTPKLVLEELMAGNKKFVQGEISQTDVKKRIQLGNSGQFPKAVILSCLDSRVPVEQVFDQGIGDIFVGRVAGNIVNEDQLGSMEFASKLAGVKLIMVMGHTACGAVKGACDNAKMGNLTALLSKIKPSVESVKGFDASKRNSKNPLFVNAVVKHNVIRTVKEIRERSPILKDMEQKGLIKIVGAIYDLKDGSVKLL